MSLVTIMTAEKGLSTERLKTQPCLSRRVTSDYNNNTTLLLYVELRTAEKEPSAERLKCGLVSLVTIMTAEKEP